MVGALARKKGAHFGLGLAVFTLHRCGVSMQNPAGLDVDVPRRAAFFGTLGRLNRNERRLIRRELQNPWQADGETLDCESVRRFIGWCAYYRISFKVLFNARRPRDGAGLGQDEECEARVFPGMPFPRGHPTRTGPSHLFLKPPGFRGAGGAAEAATAFGGGAANAGAANAGAAGVDPDVGVWHLVMWAKEGGSAPKWKTAREYNVPGDGGYPRIVGMNDDFSSQAVRGGPRVRECD